MAVTNKVQVLAVLEGLGEMESFVDSFSTPTTITYKNTGYMIQATADTAEVLPLGGVTTPELIILKCISNDVDIDTSYSSSFSAEQGCKEGTFCVFRPEGAVWFKNADAAEQSTIDYWVWGV